MILSIFSRFSSPSLKLEFVKHKGREYRRSLAIRISHEGNYSKSLSAIEPQVAGEESNESISALYEWASLNEEPLKFDEVKTVEDLFRRMLVEFAKNYYQYVQMLQQMVKIPNARYAMDFYDLYSEIEIEPPRLALAKFVYNKRSTFKIEQVHPLAALFQYMLPRKTLAEIAEELRRIEPHLPKKYRFYEA